MRAHFRYSDVKKFCKKVLGENYKKPDSYDWLDVFLAITKRKKYPRLSQTKQLQELGLELPYDRQGKNISPYSWLIHMNE